MLEVVAIELITVTQAIEYLEYHDKISTKTSQLYSAIREIVPIFKEDIIMYPFVNKVKEYIMKLD